MYLSGSGAAHHCLVSRAQWAEGEEHEAEQPTQTDTHTHTHTRTLLTLHLVVFVLVPSEGLTTRATGGGRPVIICRLSTAAQFT